MNENDIVIQAVINDDQFKSGGDRVMKVTQDMDKQIARTMKSAADLAAQFEKNFTKIFEADTKAAAAAQKALERETKAAAKAAEQQQKAFEKMKMRVRADEIKAAEIAQKELAKPLKENVEHLKNNASFTDKMTSAFTRAGLKLGLAALGMREIGAVVNKIRQSYDAIIKSNTTLTEKTNAYNQSINAVTNSMGNKLRPVISATLDFAKKMADAFSSADEKAKAYHETLKNYNKERLINDLQNIDSIVLQIEASLKAQKEEGLSAAEAVGRIRRHKELLTELKDAQKKYREDLDLTIAVQARQKEIEAKVSKDTGTMESQQKVKLVYTEMTDLIKNFDDFHKQSIKQAEDLRLQSINDVMTAGIDSYSKQVEEGKKFLDFSEKMGEDLNKINDDITNKKIDTSLKMMEMDAQLAASMGSSLGESIGKGSAGAKQAMKESLMLLLDYAKNKMLISTVADLATGFFNPAAWAKIAAVNVAFSAAKVAANAFQTGIYALVISICFFR